MDQGSIVYLVAGFMIAVVLFGLVEVFLITPIHSRRVNELEGKIDALKRGTSKGRHVIKGQLAEQLYPLLPGCQYLPSDMRFLGSPIDYLIIRGYTDAKDNGGEIEEIIFADVKQGSSQLSAHQKKIRDAVEAGRVRWETIRITPNYEVQ